MVRKLGKVMVGKRHPNQMVNGLVHPNWGIQVEGNLRYLEHPGISECLLGDLPLRPLEQQNLLHKEI